MLKKIKHLYKKEEKTSDKLDFKIHNSNSQLNNSMEKAEMAKQNKFSLSQSEAENMDNIEMIKSDADVKKQTRIQNLMQTKASYSQILG